MELDEAQRKLGIYFAAVNLISIIAATATTILAGLKEGLIVFLISVIVLTVLVQSYGSRKLEKAE